MFCGSRQIFTTQLQPYQQLSHSKGLSDSNVKRQNFFKCSIYVKGHKYFSSVVLFVNRAASSHRAEADHYLVTGISAGYNPTSKTLNCPTVRTKTSVFHGNTSWYQLFLAFLKKVFYFL